jgi:hypothetical protein
MNVKFIILGSIFVSVLCNILSFYLIYVVECQNCLPAHEDSHKHANFVKCYVPVCVLLRVVNIHVGGVCQLSFGLLMISSCHACVKSVLNYRFHGVSLT